MCHPSTSLLVRTLWCYTDQDSVVHTGHVCLYISIHGVFVDDFICSLLNVYGSIFYDCALGDKSMKLGRYYVD